MPEEVLRFIWIFLHFPDKYHVLGIFQCPFCDYLGESTDHIFRGCDFSKSIWFGIPLSLRMDCIREGDIIEWLEVQCSSCLSKGEEGVLLLKWIFTTLNMIWEARNDMLWRGLRLSPLEVVQKIMTTVGKMNEAFAKDSQRNYRSNRQKNQIILKPE